MNRYFVMVAALFGAIGVMIGAFGAHAFEQTLLEAGRLETFKTAVQYHFYHTLAALIAPLLVKKGAHAGKARTASFLFLLGVVLFSGSLYGLSFTEQSYLAYVTPFGGLLFITGWLLLSYAAFRKEYIDLQVKENEEVV